jgi:phytanoyl-CoA hydroxylase
MLLVIVCNATIYTGFCNLCLVSKSALHFLNGRQSVRSIYQLLFRCGGIFSAWCKTLMLTSEQVEQFQQDGYLVISASQRVEFCRFVLELAKADLLADRQPIEYEVDVAYPGAPVSKCAPGGDTARRLLNAVGRNNAIREFATGGYIKSILSALMQGNIYLSLAHHNCIMTKQPKYSSETGWHRDSRYWNYPLASLVSLWLALTDERPENGCLWVLPGSHHWELLPDRFDEKVFLSKTNPDNAPLLATAIPVSLNVGDILLFHSNLFHAAGNNSTGNTKYSLVFTYRDELNPPLEGTRSHSLGEIKL